MLQRGSKLLAKAIVLAGCLSIGVFGGGIASGLMNGQAASAQAPSCESDVCRYKSWCGDSPGSDTGCNRVKKGCKSYVCL